MPTLAAAVLGAGLCSAKIEWSETTSSSSDFVLTASVGELLTVSFYGSIVHCCTWQELEIESQCQDAYRTHFIFVNQKINFDFGLFFLFVRSRKWQAAAVLPLPSLLYFSLLPQRRGTTLTDSTKAQSIVYMYLQRKESCSAPRYLLIRRERCRAGLSLLILR